LWSSCFEQEDFFYFFYREESSFTFPLFFLEQPFPLFFFDKKSGAKKSRLTLERLKIESPG